MQPASSATTSTRRFAVWAVLTVLAVLAVLAVAGCSGSQHGSSTSSAGMATGLDKAASGTAAAPAIGGAVNDAQGKAVLAPQTPIQQRVIVRTATLNVTVPDVDKAADKALQATAGAGGRADGDDRSSSAGRRQAELVLRVPPEKLDQLIAAVVALGHENSRTDHGNDVTASNADVQARVQALTISVGRLQDYLKHSGSITDLIALESQLSQRQAELESTIAQQRALSDQISLATLTVDLSTVTPARQASAGPSGFGSALVDALHGLLLSLRWTGAILGYLLPFALVLALIGYPIQRYFSRRRVVSTEPLTTDS